MRFTLEEFQKAAWEIGKQNGHPSMRNFSVRALSQRLDISYQECTTHARRMVSAKRAKQSTGGTYSVYEPGIGEDETEQQPPITNVVQVSPELFSELVKFYRGKALFGTGLFVGRSQAAALIRDRIKKVARFESESGKLAPVLITGETGTGKELVARITHDMSGRKNEGMYAINCSAIPTTLLESELFGHKRGAFTGAVGDKQGLFESADKGTVFLDEIGETGLEFQCKVLRVLQDGTFISVGSTKMLSTNTRIIAATNKDLREAIDDGGFRSDLFYRLNVYPIHIPPLMERQEDILDVLALYVARFEESGKVSPVFTEGALAKISGHNWPGNARELWNVVLRAFVDSQGEREITEEHISFL